MTKLHKYSSTLSQVLSLARCEQLFPQLPFIFKCWQPYSCVTGRPLCAWEAREQPDLQPDENKTHFQTSAQTHFFSITNFKQPLYNPKSLSLLGFLPTEALGFEKPAIPQADLLQTCQSPAQHSFPKFQQAQAGQQPLPQLCLV